MVSTPKLDQHKLKEACHNYLPMFLVNNREFEKANEIKSKKSPKQVVQNNMYENTCMKIECSHLYENSIKTKFK